MTSQREQIRHIWVKLFSPPESVETSALLRRPEAVWLPLPAEEKLNLHDMTYRLSYYIKVGRYRTLPAGGGGGGGGGYILEDTSALGQKYR